MRGRKLGVILFFQALKTSGVKDPPQAREIAEIVRKNIPPNDIVESVRVDFRGLSCH